ncbi:rhomboid family intramembrane serine protease [Pseudobutyrivibrio ruminis]|uniref:rhomboid family intramembrane serine protease n=1 Tax=Pseudobutyrivibrio ruminis TaxID=46206 RepID=UPI0004183B41|nr:rhomboid family intramembrane serine protease [Pseudobutyrivibrio ruminis]
MNKKRLRITYNAPVVLSFVLICLVVLIIGYLTGGTSTEKYFMTYHSPLSNLFTYVRFFTHIFGHGGWEHFINNAAYLLLLGPMLEEKHGSQTLAEIIGITALVTGLVNYIFFPEIALCGASGVVFAFIILASFTGFRDGEIPLTFILVAIIYIGQQVLEGILVTDNISNMAHIVGGAVGAFLGYVLNKKSKYSR